MKIGIRIGVLVVALFFNVGGYFALHGSLNANTYIVLTGVIGSVASVIGLIALATPRLTSKDFRDVDADLVKSSLLPCRRSGNTKPRHRLAEKKSTGSRKRERNGAGCRDRWKN
jgi:hypothetical protein